MNCSLGRTLILVALVSAMSACNSLGLSSLETSSRAIASPTVRATFTPRPSDTPWPTFTPSPTIVPVTPGVVSGVISATVNLRLGPGTSYPVIRKLNKGTRVGVRGRDFESRWFVLVPPPNGWVNGDFVAFSTDPGSLPIIESPPTPIPTPTVAPSATNMPTATPPMYVDFRADAPWVAAGQCTILRWDVEGVRSVYFNGQGQPGHGSQEVCPTQAQTFVLHVVLLSGYLDRAITINVISAAPTLKP
jgi:uncharacterized protein YraI